MNENIFVELEANFLTYQTDLASEEKQIVRLEQDIARLGVAASMAATSSKPGKPAIIAIDSGRWYRALELTSDALLCHRPGAIGSEYAILECMPGGDIYQTSFTSWNSLDVLQNFIHERRELLAVAVHALQSQVKHFLRENHPDCDAILHAHEFWTRPPVMPSLLIVPEVAAGGSPATSAVNNAEI
jgi:hypothetical protein